MAQPLSTWAIMREEFVRKAPAFVLGWLASTSSEGWVAYVVATFALICVVRSQHYPRDAR